MLMFVIWLTARSRSGAHHFWMVGRKEGRKLNPTNIPTDNGMPQPAGGGKTGQNGQPAMQGSSKWNTITSKSSSNHRSKL